MRVARENPTWGYTRLRGALKNLGHELGRNTIKRVLAEHGIAPAPERGKSMSWSTFIKAVLSKNTNELKIRAKMAPNCLFFPVSHWFPAKTGQLRSTCDPQKKRRSRTAGSTFCGAQVRTAGRMGGGTRHGRGTAPKAETGLDFAGEKSAC